MGTGGALRRIPLAGMAAFLLVWAGQVVSVTGTNLTDFAIGVWIFQQTGSATGYSIIALCATLPGILISPFAGALVDRWDRRWTMIVSDTGAGLCTAALMVLIATGGLELWHLYPIVIATSAVQAFQFPALQSSIRLLVPERHLGRANGMSQLGTAGAGIVAPLLSGVLLEAIRLEGIVLVDLLTVGVAVLALLLVRIPRPVTTAGPVVERRSLLAEAADGWSYLRRRAGLLALLGLFAIFNLALAFVGVLFTPLLLSFSSPTVLGVVLTLASIGMLAGSLLMSTWGGPRHRMPLIIGVMFFQGLMLLLGGLRPSPTLIGVAAFFFLFASPIATASSSTIWQLKVPPSLHGRVFAIRRMITTISLPIGYLLAGPLADYVFEPLLARDGAWASTFGHLLGVGPGRGMGMMFCLLGLMILGVATVAWRFQPLRNVETEIPDARTDDIGELDALDPA